MEKHFYKKNKLGYILHTKEEDRPTLDGEFKSDIKIIKPLFNGTEVVESITQEEIDAQAEAEAQNVIDSQKSEQHAELSKTDWYVVRQLETGVAIPENILTERQAIRGKYNV